MLVLFKTSSRDLNVTRLQDIVQFLFTLGRHPRRQRKIFLSEMGPMATHISRHWQWLMTILFFAAGTSLICSKLVLTDNIRGKELCKPPVQCCSDLPG